MEPFLPISFLNDFIFCPKSIYFHNLYGGYEKEVYHDLPQKNGNMNHKTIDEKTYSSRKTMIQAMDIYSAKYGLCGKIDLYDTETKTLIERKTKISVIYDGYRYQIYAQYFCLTEMGYPVEKLFLHSLKDNTRYPIPLPSPAEITEFETLLDKINRFDVFDPNFTQNPEKCQKCIYRELCDFCF
jgi:CRISPR-associated exonuclease Cas4